MSPSTSDRSHDTANEPPEATATPGDVLVVTFAAGAIRRASPKGAPLPSKRRNQTSGVSAQTTTQPPSAVVPMRGPARKMT